MSAGLTVFAPQVKSAVACSTDRNKIKPMLTRVAFMVMIMICGRRTELAFNSRRSRQHTFFNSIAHCIMRSVSIGMAFFISPASIYTRLTTLVRFRVTLPLRFPVVSFSVSQGQGNHTRFTATLQAIIAITRFIKFGERFCFLATRTTLHDIDYTIRSV